MSCLILQSEPGIASSLPVTLQTHTDHPPFTEESPSPRQKLSTVPIMPASSYRLVTVNTAPERAKRLVGRTTEALKDRYTIEHVANCERIDEVESKVQEYQPDLVFCASMWTSDEANQILSTARSVKPDIKTHIIPHGLQVERGPDAIVEHLLEEIPKILDS
ncbi:hypothetical protein MAC_08223 [Metarhizium acridum CQMa 102]|uniref:Uncharacterized protein n=2 Tax=Metarhizium acridum TaxID=92637 RepID=E9EEC5_METAQ|nr:uncharacterized protein MAC_08223 [Metarhizium acridum CQMa 102]EFY85753.1 hypothetical protein MAC_08223 [Metarhizium acridum CQMa 102]